MPAWALICFGPCSQHQVIGASLSWVSQSTWSGFVAPIELRKSSMLFPHSHPRQGVASFFVLQVLQISTNGWFSVRLPESILDCIHFIHVSIIYPSYQRISAVSPSPFPELSGCLHICPWCILVSRCHGSRCFRQQYRPKKMVVYPTESDGFLRVWMG